MTAYDRWIFDVSAAMHERLVADLWTLGTLGIEEIARPPEHVRLEAYFTVDAVDKPAFSAWVARGATVRRAVLAEHDWLAHYRAAATPLDLGSGFRIDPRDPDDGSGAAQAEGRRLLRIPARQAFGTGSHATTRLALELLETLDVTGRDVIDVGSGSGILSMAACLLGARRVIGLDVDPVASLIAGQNRALNRSALAESGPPSVLAGRLDALDARPAFHVALVNVLPERIRRDLPRLVAGLHHDALVVSSGNLEREREAVLAMWADFELRPRAERHEEEWVAFVLGREGTT